MDSFDLKKYLAEGKLFNFNKELSNEELNNLRMYSRQYAKEIKNDYWLDNMIKSKAGEYFKDSLDKIENGELKSKKDIRKYYNLRMYSRQYAKEIKNDYWLDNMIKSKAGEYFKDSLDKIENGELKSKKDIRKYYNKRMNNG